MSKKKPDAPADTGAEPKKPDAPADTGARASLVRMKRDADGMEGDVHPDEVENYARGGWRQI